MTKKIVKTLLAVMLVIAMLAACAPSGDDAGGGDAAPAAATDDADDDGAVADDGDADDGDADDGAADDGDVAADLERVTLRFVLFGERRSAVDEVWEAMGEYTRPMINADFDIQFIAGTDYEDRLMVMAAAGEAWDLSFQGEWLNFHQMVAQDAFLELDDLLPVYAPDLYAAYYGLGILDAARGGGGYIVALPWTMTMNHRQFLKWRGDLAEEAGIDGSGVWDWETADVLLHELRDAFPDRYILNGLNYVMGAEEGLQFLPFGMAINLNDAHPTVIPLETTQSFRNAAHFAERWQEADIIRTDVLVDGLNAGVMQTGGQLIAAVSTHEWSQSNRPWVEEGARWEFVNMFPEGLFANRSPLSNLTVIPATSENPERTLMWMNLVETSRSVYDLLHFGIYGVTYFLDGEEAIYPEGMDVSTSSYMDWESRWAFWKPQFMRPDATFPAGFWDRERDFAIYTPENVNSPIMGFSFDLTDVSTEAAQRSQIYDDAWRMIRVGLAGGYQEAIDNLNDASIAAGRDRLVEEFQRQIDEFLAGR